MVSSARRVDAAKQARQESPRSVPVARFAGVGGASRAAGSAGALDMFANGVGTLRLPAQSGMMLGALSTRGCHPGFLTAMGQLVSTMAGRDIRFRLPMLHMTKAEAVQQMLKDGLVDVANSTMSCVHWPLRTAGPA